MTCRWSAATLLLLVLDLVFNHSSLKVKKGETGDTPAAGDLPFNHFSLKAQARRREKPAARLVFPADTEVIRDL